MGIIDFIKSLFSNEKKMKQRQVQTAMDAVKQAAQSGNYNEASIKAFYAFQTIGEVYLEKPRENAQTVREYISLVLEEVKVPREEVMPLAYAFEIAKYSPNDVTADQFMKADEALKLFESRAMGHADGKGKKGGGAKKQRARKRAAPRKRTRRTGRRQQRGN